MFSNVAFSIAINIIISIIIIYCIHLCWNYLKDTYSKKKTRDLVNTQIQKYKLMVDEIQQSKPTVNAFTEVEKKTMNDELTEFIQNA